MHARNRTWLLGSDPVERCRQRTMNVEGGDGSTLSLDFTTGVLDPRLTFTRTTNATFINSQGFVEWANSNMYWNTAFEGLSGSNPSLTSSGWSYGGFTGGTAVFNGDGTVTVTVTTADRRAIFRSVGFTGGGLRVIASVDVTITSGSLPSNQVINTGNPANSQHYVNGVAWNSSHPLWPGSDVLPTNTPFNFSFATDSLTSGTTSVYFGIGCQGNGFAGSATFSNPRWTMWKGSATVPYYPNTSATNNSTANYFKSNDYQAPRFDYDPTTLQPRGLLIEGSANNLCPNSQALTTGWGNVNMITPTNPAIADPFGGTAATWKLVAASGSALHSLRHPVITLTAAAHTFSFWAQAAGYDQVILSDPGSGIGACTFVLTGNGTATVVGGATNPLITRYPNGWYRCSATITTLATTYAFGIAGYPSSGATLNNFGATYNGNGTDGVYATGLQIELGSGASSFIPTGASTGNRAADSCVMTGTNFSSWFAGATEGVFYAEYEAPRFLSGSDYYSLSTQYAVGTFIGIILANSTRYPYAAISPGGGYRASGGINVAASTPMKHAAKWSGANNILVFANGAVGNVHSATSGTPTLTMFSIGSSSTSGTAATGDYLNACMRRVKFWPVALPDSQIISITT